MTTKIQINSLEALERLIGGDTELEMQIRNSVAQDFAKKYLKAMATEPVLNKAVQSCKEEFIKEFFVTVKEGWTTKLTLNDEAKKVIFDKIENVFSIIISSQIEQAVKKHANVEAINLLIKQKAEFITNQLTDASLERRLNALVDQKLKAKLGLK